MPGGASLPESSAYFLQTKRLGFRHWLASDSSLAELLWGDLNVTRLFGGPFSIQEIHERLAREIESSRAHNIQYWPVFLLVNGTFAGCCGLRPYKLEERILELGFHFRSVYWGKGFASEAGQAAITYAFSVLGAKGLFAGHHPENAASGRVLEKLGFQFTHQELYPPTGEMHPSYFLPSSR
jgi:[ribosomal protein S5]-alanine N-acetyltransferase